MSSHSSSDDIFSSGLSADHQVALAASVVTSSSMEDSCGTDDLSDYEEFCVIDEPGLGISVGSPFFLSSRGTKNWGSV